MRRSNISTEWWTLGSIMGPEVSRRGSFLLLVSVFVLTNDGLAHCSKLDGFLTNPSPFIICSHHMRRYIPYALAKL